MKHGKRFISLLICISSSSILIPELNAAYVPVSYRSCNALRNVFPRGVAYSSANARLQKVKPVVNAKVYSKNRKLDTDRDGTACEVKSVQRPIASIPSPAPQANTAIATTTSTSTTTTIIPRRPAGVWKIRWMGVGGDAPKDSSGSALGGPGLNLVYGEQTEVVLCESLGESPSTLSVKENGVWRKVADGFRTSSDSSRCADPARPIVFSFYWVVDSNGTARYRRNGRAYATRELEIQLRTSTRVAPMLRLVGSYDGANWSDVNDSLRCGFGETAYC